MDASTVLVLRGEDPAAVIDRVAAAWRPLAGEQRPVLFKPNLIGHGHRRGGAYAAVVTQPEVLELAWSAADRLGLSAERLVADAPQGDADFGLILERTGLAAWGRDRGVDLIDLRRERYTQRDGVPTGHVTLPGDPAGCVAVDLGPDSAFAGVHGRTFYGADFDLAETNRHHRGGRHEYLFSGSALRAGVVLNLPKLKTHKKAGVTLSLKNLVGLNGDKNWLPHHSVGTPSQGGDAYPAGGARSRLEARLLRGVKPLLARSGALASVAARLKPAARALLGDTAAVVRSGNWWGNDTIWRMILDLNRILLYARPDGSLADTPQRRTAALVDGLIAGEGDGPEAPDPVAAGLLVAGTDSVAVDLVATTLMGFDYRRVPHLAQALQPHRLPLTAVPAEEIRVESNVAAWNRRLLDIDPATTLGFRPHFGWLGHLGERPSPAGAARG
jgi:uncharacterized protein (DUF362 family)